MRSMYIYPLQKSSGVTLFSIYFLEMLKAKYEKVAYFCPIVADKKELNFIKDMFHLKINIDEMCCCTKEKAIDLISTDEVSFLDNIIAKYNLLLKQYDFILVCGISQDELNLFSEDINLKIAKNLASPMVSLMNYINNDEININYNNIKNSNNTHLVTIVNRTDKIKQKKYPVFCVPQIKELEELNIIQIQEYLQAKSVVKANVFKGIKDIKIAAMGVDNFILHVTDDELIVVGGDRSDIILSALAMFASKTSASISALILTGGIVLKNLDTLIDGFTYKVPILSVKTDTIDTIKQLQQISPNISYMDKNRLSKILGKVEKYIDKKFFLEKFSNFNDVTITPLMFKYKLFEIAKKDKKKIVLTELDDRVLKAAEVVLSREIVDIIFIGNEKEFKARATLLGIDISKAIFINYKKSLKMQNKFAHRFYKLRQNKGVTLEDAIELMQINPTYFATMYIEDEQADGMVCGATHTTADTVRPALQIIKTDKQTPLVSSIFFMSLDTKVLVFGDCAINKDPTADELATIAISSNDTAKKFGIKPIIAMLSYSTGNSGSGADVQKVKDATKIVKQRRKDIIIDGPMQYDSAVDSKVAKQKLPDSKVAGKATIFIFPDLNTGNNTYKAVQRSANAVAIGPVLQGLKKPINDLSRGCLIDDIINTIAITAIQAQERV